MSIRFVVLVGLLCVGCVAEESPTSELDSGLQDQAVALDDGVAVGHTDADLTDDVGPRPHDASVRSPEPRLWNGDVISAIRVGSFCYDITFGLPSTEGTAEELELLSERFNCVASDTTVTCVFRTDPNNPYLTEADMRILCAAEDAKPALDWSCTDAA